MKPVKKSIKEKKPMKKKNTAVKSKRMESSSSDPDVGQDVFDIVPPAPLDNISLHS